MSKSDKKIPVSAVKRGMYVSKLDREWLGSPFLFQGFYVDSDEDIDLLKSTCKFIYVDAERQEPVDDLLNTSPGESFGEEQTKTTPVAEQKTAPKKQQNDTTVISRAFLEEIDSPRNFLRWLSWVVTRNRKAPFEKEYRRATKVFEAAHNTISDVMDTLRDGGELDIRSVTETVAPMIKSVLRNPDAMACMVSMKKKDDYTYHHALALAVWALVFGRHLGLDHADLKSLATGTMLLDVGKTKIPTALLQKEGPLEAHEFEEVKRHVEYGLQILDESGNVDPNVTTILRTHHERHDGSGYPDGLAGNDIPVFGRIAGIIDTFDAMTSLRPHAAAMSTYDVMRHLLDNADILFQAEIIERFIQVVGMFPTGTLVELNSGEVAIVMEQNPVRRLRPKIMLILDENKEMREEFPIIDLKDSPIEVEDPNAIWISRGLDFGSFGIDPATYYL